MQPRGSARARRMWCGGPAASARHWDGVPGLTDGTNQLRTSTEHVSRVDDDAPLTHDPLRHFQRCGGRLERANGPPIGSPGWVVWQRARNKPPPTRATLSRGASEGTKSRISSARTTPATVLSQRFWVGFSPQSGILEGRRASRRLSGRPLAQARRTPWSRCRGASVRSAAPHGRTQPRGCYQLACSRSERATRTNRNCRLRNSTRAAAEPLTNPAKNTSTY